jgi:hypothetical protein
MCEIRSYLNRGTLNRLCHRRDVRFLRRWWNIGDPGKQTCKKSTNSRMLQQLVFTHNKPLRQQVHKTLIHYPWPIMTTHLSYHSKCTHLSQVKHQLVPWIGTLWDFSVIWSVVPTTIGSLFHCGRFGFCFTLGVPIPTLIGPSKRCVCNVFHHDSFGDHLQICRVKSTDSQDHDWVVYHSGGSQS